MPNLDNSPIDPIQGQAPTTKEVREFHVNADTDGSDGSIHHSLGPRKGQSSPGDHDHRGGNSVALFDGVSITGSRGGNAAVASIIAAMVELGATDSTTA